MLVFLSIDDHGFVANVGDEQIKLRSSKKYYEFLKEFEDDQFIFDQSLDTRQHEKIWVIQALGELNVLSQQACT